MRGGGFKWMADENVAIDRFQATVPLILQPHGAYTLPLTPWYLPSYVEWVGNGWRRHLIVRPSHTSFGVMVYQSIIPLHLDAILSPYPR